MVEHTGITSGAAACLYVDTTDGSFTNSVKLLNAIGWTNTAASVDVTTVCGESAYVKKLATLQSATITGGGYLDRVNDTTGQKLIFDHILDTTGLTNLFFKLYLDGIASGCHYLKAQAIATDLTIKTTPQGTIDFSFTADSTGTLSSGQVA